ncbi:MAG TPA: UDP-N-acetylglucosamine 1-carboxyvinyltransferase [Dehalococcoidia bacterium]|nr:UDP-N-acetylglucosamine 1-carboxyvinyltransferase [Dehalococcoidia bacterium]
MKPAGNESDNRLRIEGGRRLEGAVRVSGAKNASLPMMAAALLSADACTLENVPAIDDTVVMAMILRHLGATVARDPELPDVYRLSGQGVRNTTAPSRLVTSLRASFLVMGALLGRFGEAACAAPGGDVIGQRPLDVHLAGFATLGARISREGDKFVARAPALRGARVFMDYPSVLGTENILLAAVLARGHTRIVNAAAEPEIVSLAEMLNKMGARIEGAGSHTIEVEGVEALGGTHHRVIPDRIEAGTFALAAALTQGDVAIEDAVPCHLEALTSKLCEMGVHVEEQACGLRVAHCGRLKATHVQAVPYPGLATDLQAPLAVLLTQAEGVSFVHERVYDNRFLYLGELRKFGAELVQAGTTAVISGPSPLVGASVRALDVRAGAALVLAGLAAQGETEISDVFHLDRGYENFDGKLTNLGANVQRV